MTQETQADTVLALLQRYGTVSAHDLTYRHGITRAAARIWDLKQRGWVIETERGELLDDGQRAMARYRLVSGPPEAPEVGNVTMPLWADS